MAARRKKAGSPAPSPEAQENRLAQREATARLLHMVAGLPGPSAKVTEFIAANPGDGTSTVARAFARAAANSNTGPVALVELSAKPGEQMARLAALGLTESEAPRALPAPGGATVPVRHAATLAAVRRDIAGLPLSVIEVRPIDASGGPAHFRGDMEELCTWLRAGFSHSMVDGPALARSFDGVMLAHHADAVIMVVAAEATRAVVATNLRDRLAEAGGNVLAVVLTKRRFYIPRILYRFL